MKRQLSYVAAAILCLTITYDANGTLVSVTDDTGNSFGSTSGFAIDFDATTGIAADWMPDLVAGTTYSLDSVTVFANGATNSTPHYLGVYSSLTGDSDSGSNPGRGTLGGFLGVSDSPIDFSGTGSRTWSFSGINVVAGSEAGNLSQLSGGTSTSQLESGETLTGDGLLFFVYQTGTSALTQMPTTGSFGSNGFKYRRIDGGDGSVDDELAAVLQGGNGGATGADVFKTNRAPEYEASLTIVPEPSSIALVGVLAAISLCRWGRMG